MSWPLHKLKDCCTVVGGATPKREVSSYWGGDIPWITPKDISNLSQPVLEDAPEFLTKAGFDSAATFMLPKGAILLTSRAPIGNVAIAGREMCTNQGFKSLIPGENIDSGYLYHCMRNESRRLEGMGNGATFKEVSKKVVEDFEIPVPPLPEQKRIATILDKADAIRRKRQQAIELSDQFLRSVFLDLFGDQNAEMTIQQMIDHEYLLLHKDGNHGSKYPRKEDFGKEGVSFISAKDISDDDGSIDFESTSYLEEQKAKQLSIGWLKAGDVLLAHNATVGRVGRFTGEVPEALIGTSLTAYRPNPDKLTSVFLFCALKYSGFQQQLLKNMGQSTRNQVPITAQRELKVPVGNMEGQKKLEGAYKALVGAKRKLVNSHEDAQSLFASLSQRAFAGEL